MLSLQRIASYKDSLQSTDHISHQTGSSENHHRLKMPMFWENHRLKMPFLRDMLVLWKVARQLFFRKHAIRFSSRIFTFQGCGVSRFARGDGWTTGRKPFGSLSWNTSMWSLPPWKRTNFPWKSMVGRCISYWNSPFLGDMLVFQGVPNLYG